MKSMEPMSFSPSSEEINPEVDKSQEGFAQVFEDLELSDPAIDASARYYEEYRNHQDEAVKIGLFGDDLRKVYNDARTVFVSGLAPDGRVAYSPLLVSAEILEWYNTEVLKQAFGEGLQFYYYSHPPLPADLESLARIKGAIKKKVDEGAVIITDNCASQPQSIELLDLGDDYSLQTFGEGDSRKKADVFAGPVIFSESGVSSNVPSLYEVYKSAVNSGEIKVDKENGVSLVDVFDQAEAEKIWEMYEAPFAKLGKEDPVYAGFDKNSLTEILMNPDVAKVIHKQESKITSLCFFVQDFELCPWFNAEYYKNNYPDYFDSNNILIFPGIVTDEELRGSSYSGQLIDFATRLYAQRGSDVLITFECTEISTRYIPRIVSRVINHGGAGTVDGLKEPISTIDYFALTKATSAL